MLIFSATYEHFLLYSMTLAGCQINPINVNCHLPNSMEIFDKHSADKIWSKKDTKIKLLPHMPIRVKNPQCRGPKQAHEE